MEAINNEIMTVREVAEYLRLAEATIYKLAQAGEIPAVRVGRAWRFKRELIDEWLRHHSTHSVEPEETATASRSS